jgi:hypothetical protein
LSRAHCSRAHGGRWPGGTVQGKCMCLAHHFGRSGWETLAARISTTTLLGNLGSAHRCRPQSLGGRGGSTCSVLPGLAKPTAAAEPTTATECANGCYPMKVSLLQPLQRGGCLPGGSVLLGVALWHGWLHSCNSASVGSGPAATGRSAGCTQALAALQVQRVWGGRHYRHFFFLLHVLPCTLLDVIDLGNATNAFDARGSRQFLSFFSSALPWPLRAPTAKSLTPPSGLPVLPACRLRSTMVPSGQGPGRHSRRTGLSSESSG